MDFKQLALGYSGVYLGEQENPNPLLSIHKFKCQAGHEFSHKINVIKQGIWCRKCEDKTEVRKELAAIRSKEPNRTRKLCEKCNKIRPSYGIDHKTHCASCATSEMKNFIKLCENCNLVQPSYGINNRSHCATCATPEMKSIKIMCVKCNKIRPTYGITNKTHCVSCAAPEMKRFTKMCEKCNKVQPYYGISNKTHCASCATPEMKSFYKMCEKCNKVGPSYGINKATHCASCATTEMKSFSQKCEKCNRVRPNYGINNRTHCVNCATPEMKSFSKMCMTINCGTVISYNDKYNGYCARCYIYIFPNEPNARNYKTKERAMADFLITEFKDLTFITDKKVEGGCSSRRPDVLVDMGTHNIIVECDEYEHSTDGYNCESKRSMQLFQDLGNRPLYLIRFNPDAYTDEKACLHQSCWKDGLVKPTMTEEWMRRLDILKATFQRAVKETPKKDFEEIKLFYST